MPETIGKAGTLKHTFILFLFLFYFEFCLFQALDSKTCSYLMVYIMALGLGRKIHMAFIFKGFYIYT